MFNLIKYLIIGIVQGLTEPLPISSSGHVFILKKIINLNIHNDLTLEIIVNIGSLFAILIIYRKKLVQLIKNSFKYIKTKNILYEYDFKYILYIALATLPVALIGYIFKDYIESKLIINTSIIGISFLITSIFLYIVRDKNGDRNFINIKDALYIGIVQMIALLPGISRSGSTLVAALFCNLKKEEAFDFSFMLYIPVSCATTILGIKELITLNYFPYQYLLAFISSLIVSYYTLRWFKNIVRKGKLIYFSIYCLIIGLIIILFM